ncbi:MAG TPA: MgtC/SapB family protein, partial [Polyangia bacterium]|nr:MgtC/SapB family protein [Polyangia bacterium]
MNGWHEFSQVLLNLAAAFLLALPVGWDREREDVGPGLRTYPLLAMGACAYLEIGQFAFRDHIEGQARVFQALVSGIGFIGAGAIIKGRAEVHGLATAVSLWITVSIGIAAS